MTFIHQSIHKTLNGLEEGMLFLISGITIPALQTEGLSKIVQEFLDLENKGILRIHRAQEDPFRDGYTS